MQSQFHYKEKFVIIFSKIHLKLSFWLIRVSTVTLNCMYLGAQLNFLFPYNNKGNQALKGGLMIIHLYKCCLSFLVITFDILIKRLFRSTTWLWFWRPLGQLSKKAAFWIARKEIMISLPTPICL